MCNSDSPIFCKLNNARLFSVRRSWNKVICKSTNHTKDSIQARRHPHKNLHRKQTCGRLSLDSKNDFPRIIGYSLPLSGEAIENPNAKGDFFFQGWRILAKRKGTESESQI